MTIKAILKPLALSCALGAGALATTAAHALEFPPLPEVTGKKVTADDDKTYTIKFGIGLTEESGQYRGVQYFKKYVEERSDGKIKVNIFPNAQLGGDLKMVSALQSGTLEMTSPSTSPLVNMEPKLAVFDLPFLFDDYEQADKVLDGDIGQGLLKKISDDNNGLVALGWSENGYRELTDSTGVVDSPDDLNGLKIRTMQNPIHLDIWRTLGANPTPMSFAELFTALDQGTVDGQENPWITILSSRFYEVQSNATATDHVYTPFITLMSARFWDRLPAPYQQLIRDASDEMKTYQRKVNRQLNKEAREQLKQEGMTITELTDEQRDAFRQKVLPVYKDYKDKIGQPLFDNVMKATGHQMSQ
ncbi:TRAP transporter substrate-binding protein [Kushneria phosphatilytica]|uniref:TRAP transporter substrate-binding protein n=1 Tax=Kushneria phosphatilytica TaxID=657387 RepID=A0A1S1NMA2_9GAMM|nr:TRAP transporter substrate-binding protein [Kushneria phosphatilytica]OHV08024.1 ABC transporter substrate-binding protein [Kushneria phosphatilytica]QEL09935.1 TRAP transporter substrate-binding protein [Kushneria phosphatilytica]